MAQNEIDFYKGVVKELDEYNEWLNSAIQSIIQKYKYACNDNDNLRDKIKNYQAGMRDPEMVLTQVADHRWHNPKSVGNSKGRQVKGYEWKMPVVADEIDIPNIPLSDIVDLCNSDEQKEVASYYYDQKLDCCGSYQKTATALGKSRQCIYHHVKTIKKVIAVKYNK